AKIDVARRHVDLRAQRLAAFIELAVTHALQEVEILLDAAVAIRALAAGLRERAARFAQLLQREVVHVRLAGLDELHGPLIELLEVVARVIEVPAPVEAEPADVAHDRVDVLLAFLGRVGVVEAQIAVPVELLRHAEVEADRLGVADVEVAVGLGRKARDDLRVAPALEILHHLVADEMLGHPANPIISSSARIQSEALSDGTRGATLVRRWLPSSSHGLVAPSGASLACGTSGWSRTASSTRRTRSSSSTGCSSSKNPRAICTHRQWRQPIACWRERSGHAFMSGLAHRSPSTIIPNRSRTSRSSQASPGTTRRVTRRGRFSLSRSR